MHIYMAMSHLHLHALCHACIYAWLCHSCAYRCDIRDPSRPCRGKTRCQAYKPGDSRYNGVRMQYAQLYVPVGGCQMAPHLAPSIAPCAATRSRKRRTNGLGSTCGKGAQMDARHHSHGHNSNRDRHVVTECDPLCITLMGVMVSGSTCSHRA